MYLARRNRFTSMTTASRSAIVDSNRVSKEQPPSRSFSVAPSGSLRNDVLTLGDPTFEELLPARRYVCFSCAVEDDTDVSAFIFKCLVRRQGLLIR